MSAGDVRVEIYEAARKYGEIGVGVGMLKRPWQVLKWLGLAEDMAKCAAVPQDEEALSPPSPVSSCLLLSFPRSSLFASAPVYYLLVKVHFR